MICATLLALTSLTSIHFQPHHAALPSSDQVAWQNMEVGMFVHFIPAEWVKGDQTDSKNVLAQINPTKLNTDQWARTAKSIGAKYVVLVARHAEGFCLWPTKTTEYSVASIPWKHGKGDIVGEMSKSCRRAGLKFGIYLSPADAKYGAQVGGRCTNPEEQAKYNDVYRRQLIELLTNYGPITEIWFDGSTVIPVKDIIARYAPHAMVFQGPAATIRWVGNEDGFAPYPAWNSVADADAKTGVATAIHGDPNGEDWLPLEVDVSARRPDWNWNPRSYKQLLSLNQLLEIYYKSVGRGANLLLNFGPDPSGLIPAADVTRAKEFGDEVARRFGHPLESATGIGNTIQVNLATPSMVDTVVLEEDIHYGERVRRYRLEGLENGAWAPLGDGISIGHKRIQPIAPAVVSAVRVQVLDSSATPHLRELSVFDTGVAPPRAWNAAAGIWSSDEVGSWSHQGHVRIDITKNLQAAAVFRLRFVGSSGQSASLSNVRLIVDGTSAPEFVRFAPGRTDVVLVTLTAVPKSVVLEADLSGADRGNVLLQRQ